MWWVPPGFRYDAGLCTDGAKNVFGSIYGVWHFLFLPTVAGSGFVFLTFHLHLISYFSLLFLSSHFPISHYSFPISHFSFLISHFSFPISHFLFLTSYFSLPISRFYFRFRCHFLLPISFPALSGSSLVVSCFLVLVSTTLCDLGTGARCFTFFDLPVGRNQSGFWT